MEDIGHNKDSASSHEGRHLGRIIFLLTLVFAFGIGVGIYALLEPTIKIPFFAESNKALTSQEDLYILLSNSPREQILADILIGFQKTAPTPGATRTIQFLVETIGGSRTLATTTPLLSHLALTPPKQDFLRSLEEDATYQIASSENMIGLLTLHSRSYPESFAGMLAWEPLLAEDLTPALNPEIKRSVLKELRGRQFVDERFGSVDARVLRQPGGVAIIAYAFLDKKTLVILSGTPNLGVLLAELGTEQTVK